MSVDIKTRAIIDLTNGGVTVSLAAVAATTLYTVPTGYKAVLDHVDLIAGAVASTSTVTVGRSTALTDFLGAQTLSGINAAEDVAIMRPVPNATTVLSKTYAAGVIIQIDVTTANGGATNTVILWGYLIAV